MAGYLIGGRFLTGEITVRKLVPKSARVELGINGDESVTADVPLPLVDPATGVALDLPQVLIPGRDFLVWWENGTILGGGQIQDDPFGFPYTSTLRAGGVLEYFAGRTILPVLTAGQLPSAVTSKWTGLSLRTLHKRIVQRVCSWPSANLPIDYEPDITGTHEREYPGKDLVWAAQAMEDLAAVNGGPEFAFRGRVADPTHVRWTLATGNPLLTQEGADHYWDVSVPTPTASITRLDRDGSDLASHAWGIGATVDDVRLEAKASSTALTAAGFPMSETVVRRNSVLEATTLQGHVNEAVVRHSGFTETFEIVVQRNPKHGPKLGSYRPGDWARIRVGKNPRIPKGTHRVRIIRISFAATGNVTLTCAPERVAGGYPAPSSNRAWLTNQLRVLNARIDDTNRGA